MKKLAFLLALILVCSTCGALAESMFPLEAPVPLSIAITQSVNVSDYENNYFTKWLKEKTNVDLSFVFLPSADTMTKLGLMVNSGETLPDIITFQTSGWEVAMEWGMEDILVPYNDYFANDAANFYAYAEQLGMDADRDILSQIIAPDGNYYGAPVLSGSYNNRTTNRIWINQTWLDTLGLESPKTSEELYDVLVAFRDQDPNGNGKADEIAMIGADALRWMQNMFIYRSANFNYLPLNETDGVFDVSYDKDEYREFLKYANRLISEELLSPLSFTMDNAQYTALIQAPVGQVGILAKNSPAFGSIVDEYAAFEMPAGPDGTRYFTMGAEAARIRAAVTADSQNPEIAIAYTMLQYDESGVGEELPFIQRYGEKDVDWRYYDAAIDTNLVGAIPGFDPFLVELVTQWGVSTDKLWQVQVFGCLNDPAWWIAGLDMSASTRVNNYYFGQNYALNIQYAPEAEYLTNANSFTYNEDEKRQWTDAIVALNTYVDEARTLFAIGQMDPNSDADWNKYLAELEKLRYKEIIELDNNVYLRKQALLTD